MGEMTLTVNESLRHFMSGSKVVDKIGLPVVVYHGTCSDVAFFDASLSNSKSKTGCPASTFFFTDQPDVASSYTVSWQGDFSQSFHEGANVIPVYLNIQRPLKVSAKGEAWNSLEYKGEWIDSNELAQIAKNSGRYDGVIITRVRDKGVGNITSPHATTYVCFSPDQIKSALGSDNSFDPTSPFLISKSPAAQALDSYRYCAKAKGSNLSVDNPVESDFLRHLELKVYLSPMAMPERRDFFIGEFTSHLGWPCQMAINHVDGALCSGDESPYESLLRDLGSDWSLPGFQIPRQGLQPDSPTMGERPSSTCATSAKINEPQYAFDF